VWTLLLSFGLAVLLAAVDSDYRDVRHTLPFLMQLWMFSSPIVYPITQVPDRWQWAYALNPMVGLVQGFRWSLTPGSLPPTPWMLFTALLFTGISIWLAIHYFNRREGTLVDTV
jgi:lipopolysaccharide transport system permease protein